MITCSLIVKNEEKNLDECLNSVKNVVDEIVLVDTGSTDSTLKIAEQYGAKIFQFQWNDNFADARNYALENSSGDWILYLDADERLSENSISEIKKYGKEKRKIAFRCTIINQGKITKRPSLMRYVRFFAKGKNIVFEGSIHEQIENSLVSNGYKIIESDIEILHTGYDKSEEQLKEKAARNLRLLLKEQKQNPSSYYSYQLGQTYAMLGEKENAIKCFEKSLTDKTLHREYLALASRYIAVEQAEKQNWNDAVKFINISLEQDNKQPLALLIASKIFVKTGNYLKADEYCRKAYEINSRLIDKKVNTFQTILLDENELFYHAINIAVLSNNKNLFNFFLPKCRSNSQKFNKELKLFEILMNNKTVDQDTFTELAKSVNEENLEVILSMIQNYDDKQSLVFLLQSIFPRFSQNSQFLSLYGLILAGLQKFDQAETQMEKSFKINQNDPSTVFYLVSIYLQTKKNEKIAELLAFAEKKYKFQPEIFTRIKLLKEKLSPFFN